MKQSTQRLVIIIGSFALMVGSLYILFSVIMPSYGEVQELRAERQNRIEQLNTQKDAAEKIGSLINQYSTVTISTSQQIFSSIIPIGPRTSSLMNDIQALAFNNSIDLDSLSFQYLPIKPSSDTVARGLGTIRLTISLSGTYENFKSFISNLETNTRIIDVSTLNISGGAVPRTDSFTYNLLADAYYQD